MNMNKRKNVTIFEFEKMDVKKLSCIFFPVDPGLIVLREKKEVYL